MNDVLRGCTVELIEDIQLPLVNRFYKQCRYNAKAGRGERVYVVRKTGVIVAAVRLQHKSDWFFLRAMCVDPALRNAGVGHFLLQGLEPLLSEHPCFCYPFDHLQRFYETCGFTRIDEATLEKSEGHDAILEPLQRYRRQGRKLLLMWRKPIKQYV